MNHSDEKAGEVPDKETVVDGSDVEALKHQKERSLQLALAVAALGRGLQGAVPRASLQQTRHGATRCASASR